MGWKKSMHDLIVCLKSYLNTCSYCYFVQYYDIIMIHLGKQIDALKDKLQRLCESIFFY